MNFARYLIYIVPPSGKAIPFPNKYIKADTYKFTRSVQDLDSYRDADGVLHRKALEHQVIKAEWNSPPMHLGDYHTMVTLIESNFIVPNERKLQVKYYDINKDKYLDGYIYVPDWTAQVYYVDTEKNDMFIRETRFAIIEY